MIFTSGKMNETFPSDLPPELRVPEREIELLYSIDCWDGPVSGLSKRGRLYFWFEFYCSPDVGRSQVHVNCHRSLA